MNNNNLQQIRSYLSILDKIRKHYTPLIWWGSFVASKDRFNSEIQQEYFSPMKEVQEVNYKNLLKFPAYLLIEWKKVLQSHHYCQKMIPQSGKNLQIIKSFSYEHSFVKGEFKDPMFEGLQEKINQSTDTKVITIYAPLGNLINIFEKNNQSPQEIYPIYLFSKKTDIFSVLLTIIKNILSLLITKQKDFSPLEKRIHSQVFLSQFNYMNVAGLFHYFAFKNIIQNYKIEKLIYTYENNIWEKMVILQLRKNSPKTQIIGHLHGPVSEAAINFFVSEEEDKIAPLPDKIVTSGIAPAQILKEFGSYNKTQIEVGGSFKFTNTFSQLKRPKEIKKTILIGMEGVPQSLEMVNFALSQLENCPDWNVILRTHPILPLEKIQSQLKYSKELERRLEFSTTNKLQDDFDRSGVMIYWGSTLCFEAIVQGIPLINYKRSYLLDYDPLFKMEKFKRVATSRDTLGIILNQFLQIPLEKIYHEQDEAFRYIQTYFSTNSLELIKKNYGF